MENLNEEYLMNESEISEIEKLVVFTENNPEEARQARVDWARAQN